MQQAARQLILRSAASRQLDTATVRVRFELPGTAPGSKGSWPEGPWPLTAGASERRAPVRAARLACLPHATPSTGPLSLSVQRPLLLSS